MVTKFKLFEYNEENINNVLDKIKQHGMSSLTRIEKEILKNKGEVPPLQTQFSTGNFAFDFVLDEKTEDSTKIYATITYKSEEYSGYFEFFEDGRYEWYFDELEPDDDDWYDWDSLTQEVESNFVMD